MVTSEALLPWEHTLSFAEQRALLTRLKPQAYDAELAAARKARWTTLFAQHPTLLEARWASLGPADLVDCLLGTPPHTFAESPVPAWLQSFEAARQLPDPHCLVFNESLPANDPRRWLVVAEPQITWGRDQLRVHIADLIERYPDAPFEPREAERLLFAMLPAQLQSILNRVLVLEMNVARLQGRLDGADGATRFKQYVELLQTESYRQALFSEYPVLARVIVETIERWVNNSATFLADLCADWTPLRETFGLDSARLSAVQASGDTHRGGRCVMIVGFSDGQRVVYKPKSLTVDVRFQELLDWVNAHGFTPALRTLSVLDRGERGWVEYVAAQPCSDANAAERFYERQGGYLALLYALEATDVHSENIIASGEHPMMIDLEALFHPYLTTPPSLAFHVAGRALNHSVLKIGMLPQRLWGNNKSAGVDISGLGGAEGQLSPVALPDWEAAGSDDMHVVRRQMPMEGALNRPSINGVACDASTYRAAIQRGFAAMYDLLLTHRDELLAVDGPLAPFAELEIRVIVRATNTYSMLFQESHHPDLLRDSLARERHFDHLWFSISRWPQLQPFVVHEQRDLLAGDIPMFVTTPGGTTVYSSDGHPILGAIERSGLATARERIAAMSPADQAWQQWIIDAALMTLNPAEHANTAAPARASEKLQARPSADFIAEAIKIGDRLLERMVQKDGLAGWAGLSITNDEHWTLLPLSIDLYSGATGIALFLGYLGEISGEARFRQAAERALATLFLEVSHYRERIRTLGGYTGMGSYVYMLTHLGVLWDREDLLDQAERHTLEVGALLDEQKDDDLISGLVGAIAVVLGLWQHRPTQALLDLATQYGDELLARSTLHSDGTRTWVYTSSPENQPIAGFSHGAAGFAWALLKLAQATGAQRFHDAGLEAIAYERTLFDPEVGNWPDLRPINGEETSFKATWCHGAPGIALARLDTLAIHDDEATRQEIAIALRTTLDHGFGGNHSLCHGDLGNLEPLLVAANQGAALEWQHHVDHLAAQALAQMEAQGWLCGIPHGIETPGLMIGLAGVGYGLLRLAAPNDVPSVLVLAPPYS